MVFAMYGHTLEAKLLYVTEKSLLPIPMLVSYARNSTQSTTVQPLNADTFGT